MPSSKQRVFFWHQTWVSDSWNLPLSCSQKHGSPSFQPVDQEVQLCTCGRDKVTRRTHYSEERNTPKHAHVCLYVCVCVCLDICICICKCICMYIYIYICIYFYNISICFIYIHFSNLYFSTCIFVYFHICIFLYFHIVIVAHFHTFLFFYIFYIFHFNFSISCVSDYVLYTCYWMFVCDYLLMYVLDVSVLV